MRAIDIERGLTSDYLSEIMTDRSIVRASPKLIVVADHTKFGRTATAFIAPISVVDTIVTDSDVSPQIVQDLADAGVRVVIGAAQATLLSNERQAIRGK